MYVIVRNSLYGLQIFLFNFSLFFAYGLVMFYFCVTLYIFVALTLVTGVFMYIPISSECQVFINIFLNNY